MFDSIWHADWSISAVKRWAARADRQGYSFFVHSPVQVLDSRTFLSRARARERSTLIGFDFPLGLPAAYGIATGLGNFREALNRFGNGEWQDWYQVANHQSMISHRRPFYPHAPGGKKQAHLLAALGLETIDQLRRQCERSTPYRRAACPLFWTLGGNQVGKAAISGWQELVLPALVHSDTRLWPFDGDLEELSCGGTLVLAETYPAEAYGHVGVRLGPRMSKRVQRDRRNVAAAVLEWAAARGHTLSSELREELEDGFGHRADGEDRFDAVLGLCGMIEVATGHRADGAPYSDAVREWEGWIMGQAGQDEPER